MEQIKKYIRGNKERGHEVIAELEKLGGVNQFNLKGIDEEELYFIDTILNVIDGAFLDSLIGQLILTHPEWEEIKLPEQFKDGDVVATLSGVQIFIFKENAVNKDGSLTGVCYFGYDIQEKQTGLFREGRWRFSRFATEEEKQKLFNMIKANGYKWNPETKTLEKWPKFKVGDVIQDEDGYKVKITEVNVEDECYGYESMITKGIGGIAFSEQYDWKLVPNKFDISTLVPFESRVLVRDYELHKWIPAIWGLKTDDIAYPYFVIGGNSYDFCIPYEGNEHLLGTANDCDEYYKTWK